MTSESIKLRRVSDGLFIDLEPTSGMHAYEAVGTLLGVDPLAALCAGDVITLWCDNKKYHYRVAGIDAAGQIFLEPFG